MASGFEGLEVYQQARKLRQRISKLTKLLPEKEKRCLIPQMQRASLSVTNNIAEGHGSRSYKHTISYLYRSRGSVNELLDDIGACEDEGYFKPEHLEDLRDHAKTVLRLLNGYITHLRKRLKDTETAKHAEQGKARRTLPSSD